MTILPQNHIQRLKRILILLLIVGVLGFGIWQLVYSSILKARADTLIQQDQPETAIYLYQQAKSTFPFRTDIDGPLQFAKTLIVSRMKSESTTESVVELPKKVIPTPTRIPIPIFFRKPTPTPIIPPEKLTVPVLMYHHIEQNPQPRNVLWASLFVTPEKLNQQLSFLQSNGYHVVTLDQVYAALQGNIAFPDKPIVLSFDDGYRSFYDNAYPLLKYYHMQAIEFIITSYVLQGYQAYLTPQEILEMDASGLISFGAHTRDHPDLSRLSKKAITTEVNGSRDDLEMLLKKHVHWFAYPYGGYNNTVIKAVQDAGFEGAESTILGSTQMINTIFLMPRIAVDGRWDTQTFGKNIQQ